MTLGGSNEPEAPGGGVMFLSTPPGTCPVCAVEHPPEEPHWMSFYYIYRFYDEHGRVPTWEDAMGHCGPEMREEWMDKLRAGGVAI